MKRLDSVNVFVHILIPLKKKRSAAGCWKTVIWNMEATFSEFFLIGLFKGTWFLQRSKGGDHYIHLAKYATKNYNCMHSFDFLSFHKWPWLDQQSHDHLQILN